MKRTFIIASCFLSFTLYGGNIGENKTKAMELIGRHSIEFTENKGQFTDLAGNPANDVLFKASAGSYDIYITTRGLSYVFFKPQNQADQLRVAEQNPDFKGRSDEKIKMMYYRMDMNLEDAVIEKGNIIQEELSRQGCSNYFYAHCPDGIYGVMSYGKITIKNIYKGIDWVIYTNSNSNACPLKYDFVVHPQSDYKDIKIRFLNAQKTALAENDTKLKIKTIAGDLEEGKLYSYLSDGGRQQPINSRYVVNSDGSMGFEPGIYDKTKTMIIDPLVWATYYGGSFDDEFNSVCVDNEDNIYIAGLTYNSPDFPTLQSGEAYWQPVSGGEEDAFILKFNSQGVRQWATYYGGSGCDVFYSVCTDSQDNIILSGCTTSPDFPTQQMTGAYWQSFHPMAWDICVLKFNNQGIRQWATYYGGSGDEFARAMCIDHQDNVYITGETSSHDLPTLQLTGAYWQPVNTSPGSSDPFILKFNAQGASVWATYFGGSNEDRGFAIHTDNQDNLYLTGYTYSNDFPVKQLANAYWQPALCGITDAFLAKFNAQGASLWSTYYGGSQHELGYSVYTDSQDNVYFTGSTSSHDFPTQQSAVGYWQEANAGSIDMFLLKFNDQCIRQWATYYGGSGFDCGYAICADSRDNIYYAGNTTSADLPLQQVFGEYWQPNLSGSQDVFLLTFDDQCVRQWATYYGSNDQDFGAAIDVNSQDFAYYIGQAWGSDAYTADQGNGAYYDSSFNGFRDGYILKSSPAFQPGVSIEEPGPGSYISSPVPNPASEHTMISLRLPIDYKFGELVLYDMMGIEMKRLNVEPGTKILRVDLSNINAGTYIFGLQFNGKTRGGKKLVVIK